MTDQPTPPGYQPYGSARRASGPKPDNYLVWAILSTLFCCLPLGIASIVYAAQVDGKYNSGDYHGARESSKKAKQFAMWGTIIGAIVILLYVVVSASAVAPS